jgi:hypothetical protein
MGGFWPGMISFANAALVIVVLMFVLAFAITSAQETVVTSVRARLGEVKRWGGWILTVVGAWFILLAIFTDFFAAIFPV